MPELKPCPYCDNPEPEYSERIRGSKRVVALVCCWCGMESSSAPDCETAWNALPRKSDFLALIEDRLANLDTTDPSDKGNAYIAGQRDALAGLRDALNGGRESQ